MKTSSPIEVVNKVNIPVTAIESYINNNINRNNAVKSRNICFNAFSCQFESINCCSVYVPVNGVVEISFADETKHNLRPVNVQIATCYFFTCAKGKDETYKIAWGTSLS